MSIIKGAYNYANDAGMLRFIPDKQFLEIAFRMKLGKKLDLENPKTFNEKLQWLKLYDRRPEYTTMVDKYEAKKWAARRIGEKYIIPTLGLWENFNQINFDDLPNQFVLKSTHDSGSVAICRDKNRFNYRDTKDIIERSLRKNFYYRNREWPYKNVKPRIIAEKYLSVLESSTELVEYKFFCFDGEPQIVLICKGEAHGNGRTNDFYTTNFEHIPVRLTYPNAREICSKPKTFDEMMSIVRKLSMGIPQLRVDLYDANGTIYFGETTFFHDGGFCKFSPPEWDKKLGEYIKLPNKEIR